MSSFISPDAETVNRRKQEVRNTLQCPYCLQRLQKWEVPDTPFNEWDNQFMYICQNDDCPYMHEGWGAMEAQGIEGFSHRLMYIPERNCFKALPVPTLRVLDKCLIKEKG